MRCPPSPARPELEELLKKAAKHVMTREERRAQKISFVYGQLMDCAPHITKEEIARLVDEEG